MHHAVDRDENWPCPQTPLLPRINFEPHRVQTVISSSERVRAFSCWRILIQWSEERPWFEIFSVVDVIDVTAA